MKGKCSGSHDQVKILGCNYLRSTWALEVEMQFNLLETGCIKRSRSLLERSSLKNNKNVIYHYGMVKKDILTSINSYCFSLSFLSEGNTNIVMAPF